MPWRNRVCYTTREAAALAPGERWNRTLLLADVG
jgi:hypothetical protein